MFSRGLRPLTRRAVSMSRSKSSPAQPVTRSKSRSDILHALSQYSDEEVAQAVFSGEVSQYGLEKALKKSVEEGAGRYHSL